MSNNTYTVVVIDPVTSGTVIDAAINDAGEVAGSYIDGANVTHGFTDVGGTISTVDVSGASTAEVTAVNNAGAVAGFSFASSNTTVSNAAGFAGQPGSATTIAMGGTDIEPSAINASGVVVGTAGQNSFVFSAGAYAPLGVANAISTTATAVNAAGEVVGNYVDASGVQHGFTAVGGKTVTIDPTGSVTTTVAGVNASGALAGTFSDGTNTYAFTDVNGSFTTLAPAGSSFTVATGINDAGTVVGYDYGADGVQHGFVDLGGQLDVFDIAGSTATQPSGINNAGQIVGTFDNASGVEQAFTATVTPPAYVFASILPAAGAAVVTVAGSAGGELVGTYDDAAGAEHGFVASGNTVATFNDTGAASTDVTAVNASGTFTGFSSPGNGGNGHWFTVTAGGVVTDHANNGNSIQPAALNSTGEVVGTDGTAGFYAVNGTLSLVTVPGAISTTPAAVNDSGEVAGSYVDATGTQHGFTDIAGTFVTVDPAGSVSTSVSGVNSAGELVGSYTDGTNTYGFTDSNGVITTLQAPGSSFTVAMALNDAGTVTGFYYGADGQQHGFADEGGVIGTLDPAGSVSTMPTAINAGGEIFGIYDTASGVQEAFTATPACYCPGTLIRTVSGDAAVETLAIGDHVVTVGGDAKPVRWIGRRSYAGRFLRARPSLLPVRVRAGALGTGLPSRDLLLSPAHALLLDGLLIPAAELVNGVTIRREPVLDRVDYIHIELAEHDAIWANDVGAETFVDDDSRAMFSNAAEFALLYPDSMPVDAVYCAPRVVGGEALEAIRRRIGTFALATAA